MSAFRTGSAGNMWKHSQTGAAGSSGVVDTGTLSKLSIFGMVHADSDFKVYVGQSSNSMIYHHGKSSPTLTKIPDGPAWSDAGVEYSVGDIVKSGDNMYWCIEAHTSNSTTRTTANDTLWKDCSTTHPKSFHIELDTSARFVKLVSPTDVLAVVTCAAKP